MTRSSDDIRNEWLAVRCRRGDLEAWDELVHRWNPRLLYYLRQFIEHEHDAVNAVQEVWLKAFRGMKSLKNDARLAPWLYTIARRTAMGHLRGSYARREEPGENCDLNTVPTEVRFENAELVHFGLRKLAIHDREILTLSFFEDLNDREIAELLGIPVGTVKSRLFKARRALRCVIEKEWQQDGR